MSGVIMFVISIRHVTQIVIMIVTTLLLVKSNPAQACSSCGCTLNSDWSSQGYSVSSGMHIDVREDYYEQNQLRSGTDAVNRSGLEIPNDEEIQQDTLNRN